MYPELVRPSLGVQQDNNGNRDIAIPGRVRGHQPLPQRRPHAQWVWKVRQRGASFWAQSNIHEAFGRVHKRGRNESALFFAALHVRVFPSEPGCLHGTPTACGRQDNRSLPFHHLCAVSRLRSNKIRIRKNIQDWGNLYITGCKSPEGRVLKSRHGRYKNSAHVMLSPAMRQTCIMAAIHQQIPEHMLVGRDEGRKKCSLTGGFCSKTCKQYCLYLVVLQKALQDQHPQNKHAIATLAKPQDVTQKPPNCAQMLSWTTSRLPSRGKSKDMASRRRSIDA